MPNGWYNQGRTDVVSGVLALAGSKLMLVDPDYVFDADHNLIADIVANEVAATAYVRKAATVTFSNDAVNDRTLVKIANVTWLTIGGVINDTIGGAVLVNEAGGRLIAFFDFLDTPTNGGDFTLTFDQVNGALRVTNA